MRKSVGTMLLLSVIAITLLSCTKIDGTITSTGSALGAWTLAPDRCMTGDPSGRAGAYLYSEGNPNLGLQVTKLAGKRVQVAVTIPSTCDRHGSCNTVLIEPRNCKRIAVDAKLTGPTNGDNNHEAEGGLELDCAVFLGGKRSDLKGKVNFQNCD
jgi:hypothetical protein